MELQHSTKISRGIGLIDLQQGKQRSFRCDGQVEPDLLDSFKPEDRVAGVEGRQIKALAEAFQRYQAAPNLEASDIASGMLGKAKAQLGDSWMLGRLSQTGERFDDLSVACYGNQPSAYQILTFFNSGEVRLSSLVPSEGGRLEHSISKDALGQVAWESLTFLPTKD